MSNQIHDRAIIGKQVELGNDNVIGPYVVIEDGVKIGSNNEIMANAYICRGTTLGDHNQIHMGACIGHAPQDIAYKGQPSFTVIGSYNIIREFVTLHRGTQEGSQTVLGSHNFLMANVHVAHNCHIGDHVTLVNLASLTGHCIVENQAFISGMTGFHQFTRIGQLAMVSALSAINKDIPPFMICGGRPGVIQGINVVGLRRAGISQPVRTEIKEAYRLLYRAGLNVKQALEKIEAEYASAEIKHLVDFIKASKRGICAGQGEMAETLLSKKTSKLAGISETPAEEF
ncbi:MAG: acyl-[acyl-carrier-protein]--UDP-N-acetylglucosamine O-acyltransferase [Candidatus Omnitrophica bacterium CG11_big_fil_rev_8_21_14_0_20_45_26]|uniref:Acyl-[acyl-carrier-protein]--UDP-N-acetylglucosamine O-acyltransferase n=1 Tax=Candidatus Abzuiibacterium crystallinum TaxID=1974748 RepID=A0A2H0LQ39_9BACT|nr:MAG: acyl-[acyl-carrier-protein]--UDP-N-acetylglucosamine O-acyltransferase [Candidatus Omnitrophica bacterium CG11_big_fil_rev_8_21_14_0_20_45_26]PIW64049.1 MAG: acyl-[acyl-carrier-protein]--UDP-N-acetylglucosamine O-acyltransferase [Candidatus Omnitrophica bacterium CG12_big_fil_rev_8_21_14_0_65_45_16]